MSHRHAHPVTVWHTGRAASRAHLRRHYSPATMADAIALPPAVARHVITTYSKPGDTVIDPDTRSGVSLCEALRAGRDAIGIHRGQRWRAICHNNLERTQLPHPTGAVTLLDGLDDPHAAHLPHPVDLLLTSVAHNRRAEPDHILAHLHDGLQATADWIWPGGHAVIITRLQRRHDQVTDLTGVIHHTATALGLIPVDHCITLTTDQDAADGAHAPRNGYLDVLVYQVPPTTAALAQARRNPAHCRQAA